MKVYLAGSIPKGNEERETFYNWRDEFREKLSVVPGIEYLDPDKVKNQTDYMGVVGEEFSFIKSADLVLINSPDKLGVGTSQEMIIAKYFSTAVVTVLPKQTHHRRSNLTYGDKTIEDWIHPFIATFSDHIVERVEDAINWMEEYSNDPSSKEIKDISIIDKSIDYFEKLN